VNRDGLATDRVSQLFSRDSLLKFRRLHFDFCVVDVPTSDSILTLVESEGLVEIVKLSIFLFFGAKKSERVHGMVFKTQSAMYQQPTKRSLDK